jgi:hypothetical protein
VFEGGSVISNLLLRGFAAASTEHFDFS